MPGSRIERHLNELKDMFNTMAVAVREMIDLAMQGLVNRDKQALERVKQLEARVNRSEVEIDDFAVKFIALHQPEASDLRTAIMIMRMNSNLERIADHAFNIAKAGEYLIERPMIKSLLDIPKMAEIVAGMMQDAIDAFNRKDEKKARMVCTADDRVDALRDKVIRELLSYMMRDPETIERSMKLITVAQNLERIGDLSTNLAEDAVYTITGDIIKHHIEDQEREKGLAP